jgi:hypothetical protein
MVGELSALDHSTVFEIAGLGCVELPDDAWVEHDGLLYWQGNKTTFFGVQARSLSR